MLIRSAALIGLLAAGSMLVTAALPSSAAVEPRWTTLLDGTNLDNWHIVGDANWRIVDGAAQADMGGGHLMSNESYGDFVLRAEFWVDEPANSGIFIRCDDPAMPGAATCYEVNIFDSRPEQNYGTGAIVNVAEIQNMPIAANRWNTYEIIAQGDHLTIVLNGRRTVDVHDSMHSSGPITLQYGTGVVKFRKVEIRPL
nr:MAG: DUF1080 domain-containing protein [Hyphomicrobiales bacterium]